MGGVRRIGAALAASAVLGLFGLIGEQRAAQAQGAPVEVDQVIVEPLSQTMPVIGRLVASQRGVVAALTGGPVLEVLVAVGDRVREGDVMLRLAPDRFQQNRNLELASLKERQAALGTAREALALAQQELIRLEKLKGSAAFSGARRDDKKMEVARFKSEVAEAEAAITRARASLAISEIDLRLSVVRAPFNGVVVEKHTQRGAFVSAGDSAFTLVNDEDMEIEADVPASRISALSPGRAVGVTLQNHPGDHEALVRAIIPEENALTRTRAVRFTPLLNGDIPGGLAAGQTATVRIPVGEVRDVLSVHKDAVLTNAQGRMVFVVSDGKATPRPVNLGEAVGGRFVVLGGLQKGELVVIRGNERLRPGQAVQMKGDSPASAQKPAGTAGSG